MASIIPIASVILALIAAGSIAYIAWELTSEEMHGPAGDKPEADAGAAEEGADEIR